MEPYIPKQPEAGPSPPAEKLFTSLEVNRVSRAAIQQWLTAGWQDIWKTPSASLSYGIIFALVVCLSR